GDQSERGGELVHDLREARSLGGAHDLRLRGPEDEPVAKEVRDQVQHEGEAEGDDEAGEPRLEDELPDQAPDDNEERDDDDEEDGRADAGTHGTGPSRLPWPHSKAFGHSGKTRQGSGPSGARWRRADGVGWYSPGRIWARSRLRRAASGGNRRRHRGQRNPRTAPRDRVGRWQSGHGGGEPTVHRGTNETTRRPSIFSTGPSPRLPQTSTRSPGTRCRTMRGNVFVGSKAITSRAVPSRSTRRTRTCPPRRVWGRSATWPDTRPEVYASTSRARRGTRWSPVAWFVRKRTQRSTGSERTSARARSGDVGRVPRSPKRIGQGVWGVTNRRRVRGSWHRNSSGLRRAAARTDPASTRRRAPSRRTGR